MVYKPGHKKTGGRQKGTKNKRNEMLDAILNHVFSNGNNPKGFAKIWDALKEKEQMDAIIKLMPYERAMKARIENENKIPQSITINMIPASPERLAENNTIDIPHQEINEETDT